MKSSHKTAIRGAGSPRGATAGSTANNLAFAADSATRADTGGGAFSIVSALNRLADLAAKRAAIGAEEAEIMGSIALNVDIQLAESATPSVMGDMPAISNAILSNTPAEASSDADRFLSAKDVATFLSVDVKTIRRWRTEGQLPKPIEVGGVVRWRSGVINRWLADRETASHADEGGER